MTGRWDFEACGVGGACSGAGDGEDDGGDDDDGGGGDDDDDGGDDGGGNTPVTRDMAGDG